MGQLFDRDIRTQVLTSPRSHLQPLLRYTLAALTCASSLAAQSGVGTIVGTVRSSTTQKPVGSVSLEIAGTDHRVTTDSVGGYRVGQTLAGDVRMNARAVGYEPVSVIVTMRTDVATLVNLHMTPLAQLAPVVVSESGTRPGDERLIDFNERRRAGFGRFVTRADIEKRDINDTRELLRGIPGVRIVGNRVAMSSGMSQPRCTVQYFVDGVHIVQPQPDFLVQFRPRDLEGIEIYRGPAETPLEFSRGGAACGVIALWTRAPGNK